MSPSRVWWWRRLRLKIDLQEKAMPGEVFVAESSGLSTPNFTLILLMVLILLTPCCCWKHHAKCMHVSLHGGHWTQWGAAMVHRAHVCCAKFVCRGRVAQHRKAKTSRTGVPDDAAYQATRSGPAGNQPDAHGEDVTFLTREPKMAHLVSVKAMRIIP